MTNLHPNIIQDKAAFKRFLFGGNAYFTVVNPDIGRRFTYHVSKAKANPQFDKPGHPEKWFVNVLTGPDVYSLAGMIWGQHFKCLKAGFKETAPSIVMLLSMLETVREKKDIPPGIQIWHEGRCCVCGRPLTVPESIQRGIGPECAGKMGAEFDMSTLAGMEE